MTRGLGTPKKRLNIELPLAARERLERLMIDTEADSMTEVIRRALLLYEELHHARVEGARLVLRTGHVEREILIL